MAPKPPPSKAEQQAKAKKAEDKTFGLKNKNKSKAVQQYIQQIAATDNVSKEELKKRKAKEEREKDRIAEAEREAIFKPVIEQRKAPVGADPKSMLCAFFKEGKCTKGAKCKFSHDLTIERKAVRINVFADKRDDMYKDQETLEKAINDREGGQGRRCSTDIICKHFVDAVERRQYGWVWTCPNGGERCQYRHALPSGYKLKSELEAEKLLLQDEGPSFEDQLELQRAALKMRTPLTFEMFVEWRERKKREAVEKEEAAMRDAKEARAKGKAVTLSGRALFTFDPSLFKDDANAGRDDEALAAYKAKRELADDAEEDDDDAYQRAQAAPLYDPGAQGESEDGSEGEEEADVEWFCDGCDTDILGACRYDCPDCEDEFCYCETCFADAGKPHAHTLVRMPRARPHASSAAWRAQLEAQAEGDGEGGADEAGASGAGGQVDESLFDDGEEES